MSERVDRINGHSVVYRDHRFVCLHCQVRLLSVMQFHTRACPGHPA